MPVPKKKVSRTRRDKRRTHDALPYPAVSTCPTCGAAKVPHRVCGACGHYKDVQVLDIQEF